MIAFCFALSNVIAQTKTDASQIKDKTGVACDLTITFDQCAMSKKTSILITDNKNYAATQPVFASSGKSKCVSTAGFSGVDCSGECSKTLSKDYQTMAYDYRNQSGFNIANYSQKNNPSKINVVFWIWKLIITN